MIVLGCNNDCAKTSFLSKAGKDNKGDRVCCSRLGVIRSNGIELTNAVSKQFRALTVRITAFEWMPI